MRHRRNGAGGATSSPHLISPCPHANCARHGISVPPILSPRTKGPKVLEVHRIRVFVLDSYDCTNITLLQINKRSHHQPSRLLQHSSQLLRRASTPGHKPNPPLALDKAETLLATADWMGSKLTVLRIPVPCPIPNSIDRPGTALRNSSAWSCRPVGGSEVPVHLHPSSHPSHPAV